MDNAGGRVEMRIMRAAASDAAGIAQLHREVIPEGFLSSLGADFLVLVYESMVGHKGAEVLVAKDGLVLAGFAGAVLDTKAFYKAFIKRYAFRCAYLLPRLTLRKMRMVLETLAYPLKGVKSVPDAGYAELLSIGVNPLYRNRGLGKTLLEGIRERLEGSGARGVKITAGEKYPATLAFYENMGFRHCADIEVHKGEKSRLYIMEFTGREKINTASKRRNEKCAA